MSEDGGGGQTDPLTKATRTTKRNLLAASLIAITFRAFDISADKIPFAGVTINYDRGVFEFLLIVVLAYFLLSFILYYYIDIKNFPRLEHQDDTEKWRLQKLDAVVGSIRESAIRLVHHTTEGEAYLVLQHSYGKHLSDWIKGAPSLPLLLYRMRRKPIHYDAYVSMHRRFQKHGSTESEPILKPSETQEAFRNKTIERVQMLTRSFPRRYLLARLRTTPLLWTVRFAYFLRNYGVDGVFPIVVAIIALLSLYNVVPLHWLAALAPSRS